MEKNLPESMKAMQIIDYSGEKSSFTLISKPITPLKENQVRIRIHSSPINPSDLMFIRGMYGIKKKLPVVPGFEASGTIVEVSPGTLKFKTGDRVACVAGATGDGTYSEFLSTESENCIPLLDSVSLEEGSMFFVNPLTSYALLELAKEKKATGIVQTASASALGKMIIRLCKERNIPLLNIVRKDDQIPSLREIGAEHVVNSSSPNFEKEYLKVSRKLKINFFIDAVGGDVAEKIFLLSPQETNMICYGNLSEKPLSINPGIFIFQNKSVSGFWLSFWIKSLKQEDFFKHTENAQKLLSTSLRSDIQKRFTLENGYEAIEYYKNNMSAGKILIQPEI
jgi:NADPH2:quinone reductase